MFYQWMSDKHGTLLLVTDAEVKDGNIMFSLYFLQPKRAKDKLYKTALLNQRKQFAVKKYAFIFDLKKN